MAALDRAAEREKRLTDRLDEAIGLMREVERNQRDIKEIHRDLYGPDGIMGRVKVLEREDTVEVDNGGGVRLSNGTMVTIAIFIVSAALTGLWKIVEWIMQLWQAVGR